MYRSIHLNFVTRIERPLLEKLAQDLVTLNSVGIIARVVDQYLDLITLESGLFSLNIPDSFIAYNDPSLNETQIRLILYFILMF